MDGCVGQKQTMASTSLTALIAVIRLKSHTRDFCDQAQDDHWSGLVWFGLVWSGASLKLMMMRLPLRSRRVVDQALHNIQDWHSITFKNRTFMSSSSLEAAAVAGVAAGPAAGAGEGVFAVTVSPNLPLRLKTIEAFTFTQRRPQPIIYVILSGYLPTPDHMGPNGMGLPLSSFFAIFTNPI